MKLISRIFVALYRLAIRVQCKCFSLLIAGSFAQFGRRTVIMLPVRLSGEKRIALGDNIYIGTNSWLQTLADGDNTAAALSIGSGTSMSGGCVLSAVRQIIIEDNVLFARNVYIADHSHRYDELGVPVVAQGVTQIEPVVIRSGAWLGQNVVVCPGVTIGRGAVIGANSVVTHDVPDYCIAAGAPARVLKKFGESELDMQRKAVLHEHAEKV